MLDASRGSPEFARQPIEQFWMGRSITLSAKIVFRFDKASSKQSLPVPIDDHTSGERILGRDQPFGQPQAIVCRNPLLTGSLSFNDPA